MLFRNISKINLFVHFFRTCQKLDSISWTTGKSSSSSSYHGKKKSCHLNKEIVLQKTKRMFIIVIAITALHPLSRITFTMNRLGHGYYCEFTIRLKNPISFVLFPVYICTHVHTYNQSRYYDHAYSFLPIHIPTAHTCIAAHNIKRNFLGVAIIRLVYLPYYHYYCLHFHAVFYTTYLLRPISYGFSSLALQKVKFHTKQCIKRNKDS